MRKIVSRSFYTGTHVSAQFQVSIHPVSKLALFWAMYSRNADEKAHHFRVDCNQSFWVVWRIMESHLATRIEVPEKYWQWAGRDDAESHNAAIKQETSLQ